MHKEHNKENENENKTWSLDRDGPAAMSEELRKAPDAILLPGFTICEVTCQEGACGEALLSHGVCPLFFLPSLSVKNDVTSKILQIKKVFWYDLYSARFWVSGEIQSWNTFMYSEKNAFLFSFVFILGQFGRDQLRRIPANSTCRRRGKEGVTGINRTSSDKRSCEAREKSYK